MIRSLKISRLSLWAIPPFSHGGMSAISDSIKNGQDITYVILDNQTTAMTGHQPTPAGEDDILGNSTFRSGHRKSSPWTRRRGVPISSSSELIRRIVSSIRRFLRTPFSIPGVKIVIADKECGITYHRRLRRENHKTIKEKRVFEGWRSISISRRKFANFVWNVPKPQVVPA